MMQKVLLTEMCFCKEKKFAALVVGRKPTLCSHITKKIQLEVLHGHGEIIFFQRKLNFEVNLNNNLESTKLLCFAFSLNLNHENMQDITNNLK